MDDKPSIMSRKFAQAEGRYFSNDFLKEVALGHAYIPEHYFFYGTLMDPDVLARVLGLRELPTLIPARIESYRCKLWGQYPALVDEKGSIVYGQVYVVRSWAEQRRLEEYETDHYRTVGCIMCLENGEVLRGSTFKWAGNSADLRDGEFDLKDWKMRMAERTWLARSREDSLDRSRAPSRKSLRERSRESSGKRSAAEVEKGG